MIPQCERLLSVEEVSVKDMTGKNRIATVERQLQERRNETDRVNREQSRIRENTKSLRELRRGKPCSRAMSLALNQQ